MSKARQDRLPRATHFASPARRTAFAAGVLGWLSANLESFRPPREDLIETEAPEMIARCAARKAFGELGAALRIAIRSPALADRADVQALAAAWLDMAAAQQVFFDSRARLGLLAHRIALFAICRDLGRPPAPEVGRELQRALDQGYIDRMEQSAWKLLDFRHYLDAGGFRHRLPPQQLLVAASCLARRPELPHARNMDLYGVTHILFDVADFGGSDPWPLLGSAEPGLDDYVAQALAMCAAGGDLDLTAELLMCRLFLGTTGPIDRWATALLCEAQGASGYVPRRRPDPAVRHPAQPAFEAVYHTSVVSLFLLAAEARAT